MGNSRKFYEGIKRYIGPVKMAVAALKDLQGSILRQAREARALG